MKRLQCLVALIGGSASFILAGCATAQPEPSTPRIYVANESSNSVTVIDGNKYEVIGTVDARNHSTHDLALTRDGKRLFATNLASGRLSVIDTDRLETVASIFTGARSH